MAHIELFPDFGSTSSLVEYFSSIILQAIIFLSVFAVLRRFLFSPVTRLFHLRRENIEGVEERAQKLLEESRGIADQYKMKIAEAIHAGGEEREAARSSGKQEAEAVIDKAREEGNNHVEGVSKEVERAYLAVAPALSARRVEFADLIGQKILNP